MIPPGAKLQGRCGCGTSWYEDLEGRQWTGDYGTGTAFAAVDRHDAGRRSSPGIPDNSPQVTWWLCEKCGQPTNGRGHDCGGDQHEGECEE